MARPAKPVNVIQMEKKSHRTKKSLQFVRNPNRKCSLANELTNLRK